MCDNQQALLITAPALSNSKFMSVHPVCVMVFNGTLFYMKAFKPIEPVDLWERGQFDFEAVFRVLNNLLHASKQQLCFGIISSESSATDTIRCARYEWPYAHSRARECVLLFDKGDRNRGDLCPKCTAVMQNIRRSVKRKLAETPTRKFKRARISSKCPFNYLTPRSKKIRLQRATRQRVTLQKNVNKLVKQIDSVVTLTDEQSNEMEQIVDVIQKDFSPELNAAVDENMTETQRAALKKIWDSDVRGRLANDSRAFKGDQARNSSGSRSNRWSAITNDLCDVFMCV